MAPLIICARCGPVMANISPTHMGRGWINEGPAAEDTLVLLYQNQNRISVLSEPEPEQSPNRSVSTTLSFPRCGARPQVVPATQPLLSERMRSPPEVSRVVYLGGRARRRRPALTGANYASLRPGASRGPVGVHL